MGGKKKKSAAQAAAPVAPATAAACRTGASAAGNSVSEEQKKQPASNKTTKPAKENKSKGNITRYSTLNPSQTEFLHSTEFQKHHCRVRQCDITCSLLFTSFNSVDMFIFTL